MSLNKSDSLVEYFLNYKKVNGLNQTTFNKLLFQSIAIPKKSRFTENTELKNILNYQE